jgi:hypothetical protein
MSIPAPDKDILRRLGARVAEIAALPIQKERREAQPGGGNPRHGETVEEMDKFLESLGYLKAPGTRVP